LSFLEHSFYTETSYGDEYFPFFGGNSIPPAISTDELFSDMQNRGFRAVSREVFLFVGRACMVVADELYLTAHNPLNAKITSYRLWTQKPQISPHGHPDWGIGARAEYYEERQFKEDLGTDSDVDQRLYGEILLSSCEWHRAERIKTPRGDQARETIIYRLK
jgi:hypothetical protein